LRPRHGWNPLQKSGGFRARPALRATLTPRSASQGRDAPDGKALFGQTAG
jgi:hypothetical protein